MASFRDELGQLLGEAVARAIVTPGQANQLIGLSDTIPAKHGAGFGRLAKALTLIGGFGVALGLILLFGANWWDISDIAKLAGFVVLFLALHLGGLWIRWKHPDYSGTAEAFNFVGAGLFLGGVALVALVFHINENPRNGILAWLLATLPLAFSLRSTSLFGMALVAALIWGPWKFTDFALVQGMDLEVNWGFAACVPFAMLAIAPFVERIKFSVGTMCHIVAGIMIAVALYLLGFLRHMGRYGFNSYIENPERFGVWMTALLCIGLFLALVSCLARRGPKRLIDNAYLALILGTAGLFMFAAAIISGWIDPGETVERFNFSGASMATFQAHSLIASGLAWLLWFFWGVWFVFAGSAWERNGLVTLGVYGVAFGLVTRYFDLIGSLQETGAYFVVGGIVLILAGWGAEKCRRRLTGKARSEEPRS
ncbi:MAG: DUF2157 domain-containing protein [Planctomycetota bacterium]|nr:DUF2157 domain-containing protein [Planctomycetota bacterium]